MARWIHEFRSTGARALTEGERTWLKRRARGLAWRRWALAALAILAFVSIVLGIALAAGGNPLGWLAMIASVVAGGFLLSWAGDAEKLALLYRRTIRLGIVEEFRRVPGDETARRLWNGRFDEDDEEKCGTSVRLLGEYWRADERFEEALARTAMGSVETFEAVGRDGAVLWVEGWPAKRLVEPPVWEVAG